MNRAMTSIKCFSTVPLPLATTELLSEHVLEVLQPFGVPESLVDFPCCDGTDPAYQTAFGFHPLEIVIFTAVPIRAVNAVLTALLELQPDLECVVCSSNPVNLVPVTVKPFAHFQAPLTA
jgi:hypothetical protein